jgi:hypothetical protein
VIAAVEDERANPSMLGPMVASTRWRNPAAGETARYVFRRLDRASGALQRAASVRRTCARCQAALDAIHEQARVCRAR